MNYLVAVLPDRLQAEAAYTALEKDGIATTNLSILGQGYKNADEFGFIDPARQMKKQALWMAYWLVPFGFGGGFVFNFITHFYIFPQLGELGNHLLGGLFGAIGGAMGSIFVGGGIGLSEGSSDTLPYRNHLKEGKYLVIVQGSDTLKKQAKIILKQFEPETLQGYSIDF